MGRAVLESIDVDGGALRYDYRGTGRVGRFLASQRFAVDYDVDVSGVPSSILAIPWLANVCPVAWAAGAGVRVPRMDATFLASLRRVRAAMADLYPEFMTGGPIDYGTLVDPADAGDGSAPADDAASGRFDASALLFSGGVDSLATYVRHREEDPALIAVGGADIDAGERAAWRENRRRIEDFAAGRDLAVHVVGTDMHGFLDGQLLRAHYQRYLDDTWWAAVQHGLGLLGLCAPLARARGFGDLYIAATHTADFDAPWGSHPSIDDEVAWTGTVAHHDGYGLSRQEKLELLADHVEAADPELTIRSCHESAGGGNCTECEKCARTVVGLVLAGMDPGRRGYEVDPGWFDRTRERLASGRWRLGADERFMWEDLQRHADPDQEYPQPGADDFVSWLASVRVADLAASGGEAAHRKYLRWAARTAPYPVYRTLRSLHERVG